MSTGSDQPSLCVRHKGDHLDVEVAESTSDPAIRRLIESPPHEFGKRFLSYLTHHAPVEVIDHTGSRVGVLGFPDASRRDIVEFVPDAGCELPQGKLPVGRQICPSTE